MARPLRNGLGRLHVREAYRHDWDDRLKSLCGWYNQGKRMVKLALYSPEKHYRRSGHISTWDNWTMQLP